MSGILGPAGDQGQTDDTQQQDPQGQPADGQQGQEPPLLQERTIPDDQPLVTEEPPPEFQDMADPFEAADQMWEDFEAQQAEQTAVAADEGLMDSPSGDNPNQTQTQGAPQQGAAGADTGREEAAADFSLPEDFDLKEVPEHFGEEEVYNMARYVQSQKDKIQQQNQQLQQQIEEYEELAPVIKHLSQRPQLLAQVAELIQGQGGQPTGQGQGGFQAAASGAPAPQASPNGQPQAHQGPQAQPTERPTPPEKPDDYDPEKALYDPESPSGQYRQAKEQYLEDLADWNAQQTQAMQQTFQQWQQQYQQATQKQQTLQTLMYEYEMSEEEAREFYQYASSPESLSDPDLMINAWKLKKQQDSSQADNPAADQPNPQNGQQNGQPRTHEERMQQKQSASKKLSRAEQARRDNQRRLPATAASQPSAEGAEGQGQGNDLFQVQDTQDPVW